MDKDKFCNLYNKGLTDQIILEYCIEKGKKKDETIFFITLLHINNIYWDVMDYIILDISKTEPITFLFNTQHQLIKVF